MSAPLPTAAIFDMDGLMLDTESLYRAAWRRAAAWTWDTIWKPLYWRAWLAAEPTSAKPWLRRL